MSLRFEQYNALLKTRKLLTFILEGKCKDLKCKDLKEMAYRAIKHYPFLDEKGKPLFSRDEFTED